MNAVRAASLALAVGVEGWWGRRVMFDMMLN
jgi:hypothetical protein